jgi:hypothetical protein
MRVRFDGEISGVGTTEGTRIVVGRWLQSPFGTFADVMVERADGHRVLLAPATPIADFVAATYAFDEVRVGQIELRTIPGGWHVSADDLELTVTVGARTPLGWLLRAVPPALARAPAWAATVDPLARRTMSGVRTRGSAGQGRREWYAALDSHRIDDARAYWGQESLGALAPVAPPVRFGFGSTPVSPSVVRVVSTVELPGPPRRPSPT